MDFDRVREELVTAMADRSRTARHGLQLATRQLDSCSPYEVLRRGYAVVRDPDGGVLTDAERVSGGAPIDVTLARGRLAATVLETFPQEREPLPQETDPNADVEL